MSKHWRPSRKFTPSGGARRNWARASSYGVPRLRSATAGPSGVVVCVVLAAAASAGIAIGLSQAEAPGQIVAVASSLASPAARHDFGLCHNGGGTNCVVDGDTFYLAGDKVRIAGIDAPETHPSRCAEEARLGEAATEKLRVLLNSGAVTMSSIDRDRDVYGRLLRNVAVDGADVGEALVDAGVARDYGGGRRSWC